MGKNPLPGAPLFGEDLLIVPEPSCSAPPRKPPPAPRGEQAFPVLEGPPLPAGHRQGAGEIEEAVAELHVFPAEGVEGGAWRASATLILVGPGGEAFADESISAEGPTLLQSEARALLGALRCLTSALPDGLHPAVRATSPSKVLVGQVRANLGSWIRAGFMDPNNEESGFPLEVREMWRELHSLIEAHEVVLRWDYPEVKTRGMP